MNPWLWLLGFVIGIFLAVLFGRLVSRLFDALLGSEDSK